MRKPCRWARNDEGGALLAVLWLAAGLAAIVFALSTTVRGETERAANEGDGMKAYYLAGAGVERAILYVMWGAIYRGPEGVTPYYDFANPRLTLAFPTGEVQVQIVPETAKLNLNQAPPEELARLLLALGVAPERAQTIVEAIVDWRSPPAEPGLTPLDRYYLSLTPSFVSSHASFEETEELLVIRGMTRELFYGGYARDAEGRLTAAAGLRDCVSPFGSTGAVDVNTAHPAVMAAVGVNPGVIQAIVAARAVQPIRTLEQLMALTGGEGRLRIGGNSMYRIRATARLRLADGSLSELRRSVAALVKFLPAGENPPYHVLRWYDDEWVQ